MPFADKSCAWLQAETRCRADASGGAQSFRQRPQLSTRCLAEATVLDFLNPVGDAEDQQITADPGRIILVKASPLAPHRRFRVGRGRAAILIARTALSGEPTAEPWLGRRTLGAINPGLRFAQLSGDDAINTFTAFWLLGLQGKGEFFSHNPCEKPADRVLLPAGRHHDGGEGCPLGLFE